MGSGTAEMETIAGARSLSPVEVGTVALASTDNQYDLAVVEIEARSIPLLLTEKCNLKTFVSYAMEHITQVCRKH